jgi:hypothetical protein
MHKENGKRIERADEIDEAVQSVWSRADYTRS